MYNFNFMKDEKLIEIFDEILVKQGDNEKITTIALTDKRLLFLDYITNDGLEVLRIVKGVNVKRYKDIYYQIDLDDILSITEDEYHTITLKENIVIVFNDKNLYQLLKGLKL